MSMSVIKVVVFLFCVSQGISLRFGSFRGVPNIFNYTQGEGWCNPSFECDIMSYFCWKLGDGDCQLKIFDTLLEPITALENNEVDIVMASLSVTPDRAERVDFVRPYYYSSGAQIFSLPEDQELFTSFQDLISQPVCMDLGYYAAKILQDEYGLFIFPSTKITVIKLIQEGYCVATITDNTFILDGLVPTNVPPKYVQPYAVAISKNPKIQNLYNKIQNVLLEMMHQKNGEEMSYLQKLEQKYIVEAGLKQNADFVKLIQDTNINDGKYIGELNEDEIWNATDFTNIERFSDELFFVDPVYDSACREALEDIYQSYQNGTQIGDLPLVILDSVMYTGIFGVDDPIDWTNTWRILHHPYFAAGTTITQVVEQNPQFLGNIQHWQDVYLSDQKNFLQGSEHYYLNPFDASMAIDGNTVRASILSPTRVVRTFLAKNIQPKNDQSDLLIVASCAVGETRNW